MDGLQVFKMFCEETAIMHKQVNRRCYNLDLRREERLLHVVLLSRYSLSGGRNEIYNTSSITSSWAIYKTDSKSG